MISVIENSNDNALFEMATLRKKDSGLPVNVYIDDTGSWIDGEHGPRIKFQGNRNSSADTNGMIPMTISDDPKIPILQEEQWRDLTGDDIKKVKQFVKLNKDYLLRLCDRDDDYSMNDFYQDMVLLGDKINARKRVQAEDHFPKIIAKSEDLLLIIQLENNKTIAYDMNPAIKNNTFLAPLKDKSLFSQAKLEGKLVVWNEYIQIPLATLLNDRNNILPEEEYKNILGERLRRRGRHLFIAKSSFFN